MALADHAREVRNALSDPARAVAALGLEKGATRQAGGFLVCCPAHGERNPSCSVTRGPDGTIRVRCFGCGFSGDVLHLVAQVHGLSLRGDEFREVLALGAHLAGHLSLESEILDGQARPDRKPVEQPKPEPERGYLMPWDVMKLWRACTPVTDDTEASGYLVKRRIDPELVDGRGLGMVVPASGLPWWASYRGQTWNETGHRIVVRAFDSKGTIYGLRAIRVRDGDGPKRLPIAGHKAAGLALMNAEGWKVVARGSAPGTVVIVEGEPDFLTTATMEVEPPVFGLVSGSWTDGFAAAMPRGATVLVMTHADDAGDRYAQQVIESIKHKCAIRRLDLGAAA